MEKIVTVTIADKNYKLDASAYKLLTDYDRFIKRSVKDSEKILDIETQMSVLIDTDLIEESQVVDNNIMMEAINIIGRNENIRYYPGSFRQKREFNKIRRKERKQNGQNQLSRNTNNGIIGGVCAGIADNIKIDPVIVRIIYIILSFLFLPGILVYIILWIVLPVNTIKSDF